MSIFFSATTFWFYDEADKEKYEAGIGWPTDSVPINNATWERYRSVPPDGFQLGSSADGGPAWVPVPPPTQAELISAAEEQRQRLLLHIDEVTADWRIELMLGDISDEAKANLSDWMGYKKLVKAVNTSTAPNIDWPTPPVE